MPALNVSYQVDLFGKIARAVEATGADTQAAQAAYDLARVSVAADTTRAYVDACSAGAQLNVAQHSLDLQQQFVRLTGARVKAGRGTELDTPVPEAKTLYSCGCGALSDGLACIASSARQTRYRHARNVSCHASYFCTQHKEPP